jgi:hypothetical protein
MLLGPFARLRQFFETDEGSMRIGFSGNYLKLAVFVAFAGSIAGGQSPSPSDEPLTYVECKEAILAQARTLWAPEQVDARTLEGKFELTLRLAHRLRTYFGVSNGLATKLTLSAEGLRSLVALATKGAFNVSWITVAAILTQEERRELDALVPLLPSDTGFLTLVLQIDTIGNMVFGVQSPWRDKVVGDPLFIPILATYSGGVGEVGTLAVLADFASRYSPRDQKEISLQMARALSQDSGLRLYLANLFTGLRFSTEGVTLPRNRMAADAALYIQTMSKSAGYKNIKDLNKIMVAAWTDHTGHLEFTLDGFTVPFWRYATSSEGLDFTRALTHLVKGQDAEARVAMDAAIAKMRQTKEVSDAFETRIRASVLSAAMDRRFRLTAFAQFLMAGKPSPEVLLATIAARNLEMKEMRGAVPFMPMMARYQQLPLINAALLYASLVPGSKILEVGYEKPVLMVALRYYLSHIALAVGVDSGPVPQAQVADALKPKIELLQGTLVRDPEVTEQVEKKGPYDLIYGVDVFRHTYGGWGADFDPSVDMQAYLRWVHDNMSEGGIFLVLNDNELAPNFTRQQAEHAGLTIVRWAEDWTLPADLREVLAFNASDVGAMRLFVLRKGGARDLGQAIETPGH